MWIQGTKILCARGWDWKALLRSSVSCSKTMCLGSGVWGVWNLWCRQKKFFFVIWSCDKQWEIFLVAISKCYLWWCRLLRLNLGAPCGEHLTSQLSWIAAWPLVTGICPVCLVDALVLVGVESKDKIMLQCFREVECKHGFTTEIWCKQCSVNGAWSKDALVA